MSSRSLIEKHRAAIPGRSFIAIDGERMSDQDDYRLWDMLWRIYRARNQPITCYHDWDYFKIHGYQNIIIARKNARIALDKLKSWYRVPSNPHSTFSPANSCW
jgi:hypothetical protein